MTRAVAMQFGCQSAELAKRCSTVLGPLVQFMRRKLLIAGIVVGTLLSFAPFFGLFGTVLNMFGAFKDLGDSGVSNPNALSAHIGNTLLITWGSLLALPIGLVLLITCIIFLAISKPQAPPVPSEH